MDESHSSKIVIATGTLYTGATESEKIRSALAIETIEKAGEFGYPIIVLDQGSSQELIMSFETAGGIVKKQHGITFGQGRREAMKAAGELDKAIIVWTEPEKYSFIPQIAKTTNPILNGEADLVIPKRQSLASYPTAQQWSEPFANAFFKELTKCDLDTFFGPRVFKKEMLPYFVDYDGSYGDKWDTLFIPILNMIHDGK